MVALARSHVILPQSTDAEFKADVLAGLSAMPKRLQAKYFYDGVGSHLFERITGRAGILPDAHRDADPARHAADIAKLITPGSALVEIRLRLEQEGAHSVGRGAALAAYVPVDICGEMIEQEAIDLRPDFPQLKVLPVVADICYPFELPAEAKTAPARVGFFPGSTIGNFEPHEAASFLRTPR